MALTTQEQQTVIAVMERLQSQFSEETTGHDWWHIQRVHKNALVIASRLQEPCNLFIVELGALLHDIADWKFHGGSLQEGPKQARLLLEELDTDPAVVQAVEHIVENVSFKGVNVQNPMQSIEGMVVQDADRLDALGAIGIARAFAYGGKTDRQLYNPEETHEQHSSFEEYKESRVSSLGHFYEKILFLKDKMNTEPGKQMAEVRHQFVEEFLAHFHAEWEGDE